MAEVCHCVAVYSIYQHMSIHIHKADGELKTQGLLRSKRGGVNFIPALPNVAVAAIYLNFPFIGPFVCNVNLPPTSSCEMPCSSSRFFFPFHPLITSKQFTARKISAPALWFCVVPEGVSDSRKWMTSFSHLHIHTHTHTH